MTKVLGLTGGIASGKTTVSNYLKSLGIDVIDADIIAREVMQAGEPVVLEIAEAFGNEMLLPNGEIDRQRLGESIFQSEIKREKLNQLVQGKIYREIMNQRNELLKKDNQLIVLDIPLLYEKNYEKM
ncbi:MAG: dephospho-CoA kinase, partial [Atopostipes suicloacalis]|nr:dephospho-CoA kinase [Atopostipes suicloacalis]